MLQALNNSHKITWFESGFEIFWKFSEIPTKPQKSHEKLQEIVRTAKNRENRNDRENYKKYFTRILGDFEIFWHFLTALRIFRN